LQIYRRRCINLSFLFGLIRCDNRKESDIDEVAGESQHSLGIELPGKLGWPE
jgi:hypothetical protein